MNTYRKKENKDKHPLQASYLFAIETYLEASHLSHFFGVLIVWLNQSTYCSASEHQKLNARGKCLDAHVCA